MYSKYSILAVHIEFISESEKCRIIVAIESAPGRFKSYERWGDSAGTISTGVFQEVAAYGGKLSADMAKEIFPELKKKYKYG